MIRRGFWFAAGAVVGIAGYRRISRAARVLLPQADLLAPIGRQISGQAARRALGPGGSQRDPGEPHEPLMRQPGSSQAPASRKAAAATAAFVRDVRVGMADYLDEHRSI